MTFAQHLRVPGRHRRSMTVEILKSNALRAKPTSRRRGASWSAAIAHLADCQHGIVAVWQLRLMGMSIRQVMLRVEAGLLRRLHPGVYAFGHRQLSGRAHRMAAVLACGPGAVVSHRSAAWLWGLLEDARAVIDVTALCERGRLIDAIRVHSAHLAPKDIHVIDGIPCTSVARTLLDLAGVVDRQCLAAAFLEAERKEVLDLDALRAAMGRVARPRGARNLRRVIADFDPDSLRTESTTEVQLLRLCAEHQLPPPRVNEPATVEGVAYRPDFLWPAQRLIVETDGGATHSSPRDRVRDFERDERFRRAGYLTRRFSWRQVTYEPEWVARTIRRLLAERGVPRRDEQRVSRAGRPASP